MSLDKRLKGKFEMINLVPGVIVLKGKQYDTRKMSAKEADAAIKNGASFIRRIDKK